MQDNYAVAFVSGFYQENGGFKMIKLKDLLNMFPKYQLVSLADEDGSHLPYGHRDKIIDLEGVYEDAEVLNMRIVSDVLYIRIKM